MAKNINLFLSQFKNVKETAPGQYICKCPAHNDRRASLSIKDETALHDKILLSCHAGCNTADVLSSIGMSFADIQPGKVEDKPKKLEKWQRNLTAEYRYTDEHGNYLYSKLRYESDDIDGKVIRYAQIVNGKYISSTKGEQKATLYNINSLSNAINTGMAIYYVEGEKDVETLKSIGLTAVTAGGTSDWRDEYAKYFIGASEVIIIADNDEPGRELSSKVSKALRHTVYSHKIITPSNLNHGDVTDYIENGGTREGLFEMVQSAPPIFAYWCNEKGKVNPSLLADEVMRNNHIIVANNPGTKSDQVLWYINGVYKVQTETTIQSFVDKYLPDYISNPSTLKQTSQMISVRARKVNYNEINKDEHYINVKNGLISVPDFDLVPHTPDLLSTVQLNCEYDPNANAPTFDKFKDDFCRDEDGTIDNEMLRLDRMKMGIILSSMYGYRMKAAFVQWSAEGNTGKSVDVEILNYLVGANNVANVSFQAMSDSRWATGQMWGKRLVSVADQGRDCITDSSVFKQITGGDMISAEFKGIQHFNYRFNGIVLIACNHLPVFEDDKGNHMSERLHFIHCRNVIPEERRDPMLRDKLEKEASGILNRALEGLKDYIDNGYHLCPCESSKQLKEEYRCRFDTLHAFMSEYCDFTKDSGDYIDKVELEDKFMDYCSVSGLNRVDRRNIKTRAASHGVPVVKRKGYWVYKGIRWKTKTTDPKQISDTAFTELGKDEEIPF